MELDLENSMKEKRLAVVEHNGYIELSPDISETMDWEPGTELMGSKVDGMLILEPFSISDKRSVWKIPLPELYRQSQEKILL